MSSLSKFWKKYVTGSYYADKANQLAESETARQNQIRQQMKDKLNSASDVLRQKQADYLNAVRNANASDTAYLNNYLAQINNLPDINYNQGVTSLYRNIRNTENTIRNQMASRGISGAGVDFRNLLNSEGALARGISALQAQRQKDSAETAQNKYSTSAALNSNNFNRLNSYYNYNPQMLQSEQAYLNLLNGELQPSAETQQKIQQYQSKASNPALGGLISAGVSALTGNIGGAIGSAIGGLFGGKKSSSGSSSYSGSSTGTSLFGNTGYNTDYLQLTNPVSVFQTPNYVGNNGYYDPYSDYAYMTRIPDYQLQYKYQ